MTFDELRHKELPNWSRWARSYLPKLSESVNPIYGLIKHEDDPGHGSIVELLEMVRTGKLPLALIANLRPGMTQPEEGPIREKDALKIDGHLEVMMHRGEHSRRTLRTFRIIKNEFYRREVTRRGRQWRVKREDLDEAIRCLLDMIYDAENKGFASEKKGV